MNECKIPFDTFQETSIHPIILSSTKIMHEQDRVSMIAIKLIAIPSVQFGWVRIAY